MTQKDAYHCSNLYCFASSLLETHIRSEALKFMKVLGGHKRMQGIYMSDTSWKALIVFDRIQFFNFGK